MWERPPGRDSSGPELDTSRRFDPDCTRCPRLTAFLTEVVEGAVSADHATLRMRAILGSVDDVRKLAGEVVEHDLKLVRSGLRNEAKSVGHMVLTYQRFLRRHAQLCGFGFSLENLGQYCYTWRLLL